MNTLISGGTGLIGRELANSLLRDGHQVWILTRNPQGARVPAGAHALGWNGSGRGTWESLMEQVDAVVHLAGASIGALPWSPRVKADLIASRTETGQRLVDAVAGMERKPSVFLQISGIGYYGTSETAVMTEESPPGNDFQAEICLAWEGITLPVEELGVRHVVARTAPILARDEGILPRLLLPFKLFVGGPLGSGRQFYSWIHMKDQIAAMRFLLEQPEASGPFNLASPNPLPQREFARVIGRVLGRPAWFPTPAIGLKTVLGEMSDLVLKGQRVLPRRLLEMGFKFQFPELEPALRDLLKK